MIRPPLPLCGALIAAVALSIGACGPGSTPATTEATVRPHTSTRPDPVEALTEEPAPAPDTSAQDLALVAAATGEAQRAVEVSRRFAAPRLWRCDPAQVKRLTSAKGLKLFEKESDRLSSARWEGSAQLRQRVPQDADYWRRIRWGYVQRGICDPERFVLDGIVEARFAGAAVWTHVQIAPLLSRIEARLKASEQGMPAFNSVSSFSPRTVRGPFKPSRRLSNHALGLAVDIDPALNPYLSGRELAFIEKLTGARIARSASIDAGERWDQLDNANSLYRARIGPWLDKMEAGIAAARQKKGGQAQARRLERALEAVTGNRNLMRAADDGFLSLPRHFVVEMEAAGLTWCTDFGPGADLMHFELRGHKP